MDFPSRTLDDLAYGEILHALSTRCRTEPGRQRALVRPFLDDAAAVGDALTLVDEARKLAQEQFALPFGALTDVRPALRSAEKRALLEPKDLVAIAQALFAFERLRDALEEREHQVPALATIGRRLPRLEQLARRVDRCFEADGEISDRASPALKEARDRARGLHRHIKTKLDGMLHDEQFLPNLRESYYTLRNNRYVVPVLASSRSQVPGIVHNASQSGQTLFVEPEALVGMGNDLAIAQSMVLEEERRVLQELTDAVGREADAVLAGVDACAELDEAEAAAHLAADVDLARPEVVNDGTLELFQLRHPLLVLRGNQVVSNDVRLEGQVRALVVSGPNAGGKTVTLTAVGVCALMLRAGLPIPAGSGSRMPLYKSIQTAIGDAQDLNQGLSTFSAHVVQLREIARNASHGSLVLVDEIAADTDPREGAAIAIAVLEDLLDRGAVVLVTTHLEELKALAHMDPRFINARVGFDSRKMAPTYKLQLGAAGSSSAIDIAHRMGLADKIVERARELSLGAGGPLAKALAATEDERRKLAEEVDRAKAARAEAEATREKLEREKAELEKRRAEEKLEHEEAMRKQVEQAQAELKELLARLRAQASMREAMQAQQELSAKAAELDRRAREARARALQAEAPQAAPELRVGGWVHHVGLNRDVEVLELEGDEVLVAAGPLKMRVPKAELASSRQARPAEKKFPTADKAQATLKRAREAAPQEVSAANFRCDVRGMRADDAVREIEQFMDRVFRSGEEAALIIHGHGTGALKQGIREFLQRSPYVRGFRAGDSHEGGDGVTVVSFKG